MVQDLFQAEGDLFELQPVGLDLGQVEDVVDESQQGLARILDLVEIILLFRRQLGLQGQVGQADDRVHGGADLVAHVGQEFTLGPVGRLGRVLGPGQFVLDPFAFGDVGNVSQQHPLVVQRKGAGGKKADHDGTAFFPETIFLLVGAPTLDQQ